MRFLHVEASEEDCEPPQRAPPAGLDFFVRTTRRFATDSPRFTCWAIFRLPLVAANWQQAVAELTSERLSARKPSLFEPSWRFRGRFDTPDLQHFRIRLRGRLLNWPAAGRGWSWSWGPGWQNDDKIKIGVFCLISETRYCLNSREKTMGLVSLERNATVRGISTDSPSRRRR